jgi:hypothetical protein
MLGGEIAQRILLIQAASGMGKTSLLAEFAALCPVHAEATLLAKVDLKGSATGIAYVFSRLQRELRENKFTLFEDAINRFLSAGVEVTGNTLDGTGNQIQLVLNTESEESRNMRLNKLQEAFFRDLQAIKKPIMIVFDTFNDAPALVADWIGGGFLAEVAAAKNIWVVIAGQSIPKPTIEWMDLAEMHHLDTIDDIEAWHSYTTAKGLPFEREAVKAFVRAFNGQPAMIIRVLENEARRWKHE